MVIPPKLRRRVVKKSHKGHQGLSKTKALIREFCWFPGIDAMVNEKVKPCVSCQVVNTKDQRPDIKPHPLPEGPWMETEMDYQGPYPSGEYIFIMIDRFSKWPEMQIMKKPPDAMMTRKAMKGIFDRQGVPEVCQADNGPTFRSEKIKQLAREEGFELRYITPYWPQANGEVERFNRSMT